MFEKFFITAALPANAIHGEYFPLLVLLSYAVAVLGAFTGLTLAARMLNAGSYQEKQKLHWAGAVSLGSGIWSMHFIGMLAYHTKMEHNYDPLLTTFSGFIAITVAWFVLKITQAETLSRKRLSVCSILLGLGIATMHYTGMEAMQMEADLRYLPGLFAFSIVIAIAASGAALWIILTLGRAVTRKQIQWRVIAALIMGVAICGMHYIGMAASVIIPFADCRVGVEQSTSMLEIGILAVTGLICVISLMLGVANRLAILIACAILCSLPLITIIYQGVSVISRDIQFTQREQQGILYHKELINLLLGLQKLRGLTHVVQNGGHMDEMSIREEKKRVTDWIAKVDENNQRYDKHLNLQQDWSTIKIRFNHILDEHIAQPHEQASKEFAEHTKIIREFMTFMNIVVDKSNLNTDPEPGINLIADVLYNLLPETTETLGKMRGLAAGYLASGDNRHENWEGMEDKKLRELYSQFEMLDPLIENRLLRSTKLDPNSQNFMDYHTLAIKPKLEKFKEHYENTLFKHKITEWSSQSLFADATEIIQAYDKLYGNMTESFSSVLEQRQSEYSIKKNLVLFSSTVSLAGCIALFIFLFRSLTKTEHAEREARHARKTAEQAAAAKSDFLANMSHELRTPMNGVLGMAQLLEDTSLTEEQKQYVSTINGSGENLLMLLNDILDFSKIEAGALTLENIAYHIKNSIHGAMNLLQPQSDKKGVDLQIECEPEVPDYVWGDSGRLRQIITNLVGNAIKFTENGYVRLSACIQEREKGSYLHVRVEDTGMGIPADKMGSIFDKFTQADASVTRKFGGTGLGLAITKQLVELMGGNIGVESVEGKGSTFWFIIPCVPASKEDVQSIKEHKGMKSAVRRNLPRISDVKILLVEDYLVNQVFAEKLLRKFGARNIEIAENGVQALQRYRSSVHDMIFMDCQMPEMDGYQATIKIRELEDGTPLHTPIIAMTANAMMGDREKCLKAGMDDYLSKPLRAGHLKKILESWFLLDDDKAAIAKLPTTEQKPVEDVPVDMEQLRVFTDGDPEEEKALFVLFLQQAQSMLDILQQSTDESKNEAWRSAAHRFKGSSGNLGAMKLHHLCKRAETNFDDIEPKKLEMLAAIKAETIRVEKFIHVS